MTNPAHTVTIAQVLASTASALLVADTAANIAAALPNANLVARVSSFTVSAPATVTAPQLLALATLGTALHASAGALTLNSAATVTATQLTAMEATPGFTLGTAASLTLSDTTTQINALLAAHPAYFAQLAAVSVTLDGTTIGAYPAVELNNFAAHKPITFVATPGHTTLTIAAAAHDLGSNAASLNALRTHVPLTLTLTNDGTAVIAADAAGLATLTGFSPAAHTLYVSDTAANIAARASTLFGAGFATIQVMSGTFAGTAAQLTDPTLRFLSGAHAALAANAVVSALSANTLAGLPGYADGGHTLTVADTAANLLVLSPAALSAATATTLTAAAMLSAAQATTLLAEPGFTPNGHALTIADTAANLLALPQAAQSAATILILSAAQSVSAAQLAQLAALGSKFNEASHTLTVADTAANLAALSPGAQALAGAQILTASATVSAITAATLAGLNNLSQAQGVTLTVQDSVANLIALGSGAPAITALVQLAPASMVTISAAQAHALANIPHFAVGSAQITVADTVADFLAAGNAGWQIVEGSVLVADTAGNLAANASLGLVQNAAAVSLVANAQVSAIAAAQIATIPHFASSPYALTVSDTAADIAAHAAAIVSIATGAIVTDSGPVNTAVADQLATVSAAGKLSFQGGDQLLLQDTYANLVNPANSTGYALAARIGVTDTAANLVTASAHNWGALNPTYTLSAGGLVSAAQAETLAGLAAHYSNGGFTLQVQDSAAAVAGAASALAALGITAIVADTAAGIDAYAGTLQMMGAEIAAIHTTDTGPVTAATAAGLSGLAGKLSGPPLQVADTAAHVESALAPLVTLGNHVAVSITDSAADVAANASGLAMLGHALTITLTDSTPVTAAIAAGLVPVAAELAPLTTLAVTDTGAAIAAHLSGLLALGPDLGALTLADGTTQTASVAAALAPLDQHLAAGLQLIATGMGADITANEPGLLQLRADGHLAYVLVANTSVADAVNNATALNILPASVTIQDSAADVDASLAALSTLSGLAAIALTDSGTPALGMSIATLAAGALAISRITTPFTINVFDTAADIAADIAGPAMSLAAHASQIGSIFVTDGMPVILTQAQILSPGTDDSGNAALAHLQGTLDVTGVDLAHLAQMFLLPKPAASVTIADSSANIAADLAMGSGNSQLLGHAAAITHITSLDGAPVSLTAAQALAAGVDDSPSAIVADLSGASLAVTGASIAQLPSLAQLQVPPATIAVTDTAADIAADIANPNSALLASQASITTITVSDGQPIALTEAQALSPGVDDGLHSILAKIAGGQFSVSGVDVGHLAQVLALPFAPASVAITDTAAHIASGIATVAADIADISSITVTAGPLTLSAGEALLPHIDDSPASVIGRLAGHVFDVTGASVAQLAPLALLPVAPAAIAVTDSATDIVTDLFSGASSLITNMAAISAITVTHGTLTLTDQQADAVVNTPALQAVFAKLAPATTVSVTGVPVADLASLATSGYLPHVSVAITDTANNLAADLNTGTPSIYAHYSAIASVTLESGGTYNVPTLTDMANLPNFSTGGFNLTVQDSAYAIANLGALTLAIVHAVQVVDSGPDVAIELDALQARYDGALSIALYSSPAITVSAGQYVADAPTIDAIANQGVVQVTGNAAALAPLAATLAADTVVGSVTVTDSANNVVANIASLQLASGKLAVNLTDTSLLASVVAPLLSIGGLNTGGIPVVDTGAQIAALVETGNQPAIAYLNTHGASLASDSAVTATDAAALESLTGFSKASHLLEVWDTASHLTAPAYMAALANGAIDSVHLKTTGGSVSVTAFTAAALFAIPNFSTTNPNGSPNTLNVSDTAAHLDASFAALSNSRASLAGIAVNAPATISDQTLADLQALGATTATALTVRDTAATIANNAGAQGSGQSLEPTAWALSANGNVSEAQAVVLGTLPNFSAGPYTVTLNLPSGFAISLADANALGNIAGALVFPGAHPIVGGSVAQLQALTPAALTVVTPALDDSAANIAALPASSPLLAGTVEVFGNDTLGVQTVEALLALVHTGPGQGIAAGNLSFDSNHLVLGTIADLHTLTASTGWTANPSTHPSLALAAFDSVANLINPANTSYLSGLALTGLNGFATITAASASSLANLAPTIHFDHNAPIIVLDSAAALLNPSNASGLSFADSVSLAGPATVDAADAESLFGINNFTLGTPLTISDSSANLLDGTLAHDIAASGFNGITVQLAGPETLDADTAEALVSLPGFADTTNLTIADASSYLLNSANLSAEHMAASVTLAGDETVSANTVLRLSEVPHFTPGSSHLLLANNDFANAATLHAIADDGTAFQSNGYTITLTQDALDLTPTELTALQSDTLNTNGHLIGITPTVNAVTDAAGMLTVSATGIAGGIAHLYAQDGTVIATTPEANATFTLNTADAAPGHNFALTESVGGVEGAPVVILDAAALENAASLASATFSSTGQIQIDPGKFVNLYQAGSVPALAHPALVYDPVAHTVSLDLPGAGAVTLITLGGTTHPASLDLSEIIIKHHG